MLWPIDSKLGVWVAFIKSQLWIATQVSVIKVKVTITNNRILFSLLGPIYTKLGVWVHGAYIKPQLWIATHVYVIKVKVNVTKNRNSVSISLVCFGLLTPNLVHATNATKITASFFLHCHLSFLIHVTSILG